MANYNQGQQPHKKCPPGQIWSGTGCVDAFQPPIACPPGWVPNCAPNAYPDSFMCCTEHWIGDGEGDCEDQVWGCDLTCYDNDGGDCDNGGRGAGRKTGRKARRSRRRR